MMKLERQVFTTWLPVSDWGECWPGVSSLSLSPLPAPPVTTDINIITIRGTRGLTCLHLLTPRRHYSTVQSTMFSFNMRGLCHASLVTVSIQFRPVLCHPPDNWPECQILFISVHQSLYYNHTMTNSIISTFQHKNLQILFQTIFLASVLQSQHSLDYWMISRYFLCFLIDLFCNLDIVWC